MKIYFYNTTTFEYTREQEVAYDHWGNEIKYPNTSYDEPLEAGEFEVCTFDRDKGVWEIQEDYRGQEGYLLNHLTDEWEWLKIKEIGPLPVDFKEEVPEKETTLEEDKEAKNTEIDNATTKDITSGFWFQSAITPSRLHFSYDNADQTNINSAMNGVNLYLTQVSTSGSSALPSTVNWNGYEDAAHTKLVIVTFDAASFVEFWGYSELTHKAPLLERARKLKDLIKAATTKEEVAAISWSTNV